MDKKGLTLSMVFEAESANYGEGFGNISQLKKLSRGDGNAYTYISRQALRYNLINQLGWDSSESVRKEGAEAVVQFAPNATIDRYPEIDLFGYLKTSKGAEGTSGGSDKRNAVVRLSNAVSLESFNSETDFLTNMGLASRIGANINSIAQSEIHKSFYTYTITIDLDLIGIDKDISIPNPERAKRVKDFLGAVEFLYRDIKGRRENLSPVFLVGGVYKRKNPFFENRITLVKNKLDTGKLKEIISASPELTQNTKIGYLKGTFSNDSEIILELKPLSVAEMFGELKQEVDRYYA